MSLVDLGKRLLESAKQGETEEVRILMTNGAPFTTDWLGMSPLHMAAQYGHRTTAEVLLRGGISRDARTKIDRTPLHVAAQEGHWQIVELLIQHGAEVDPRDMLKMTPLHWAVERSHSHVVQFLLKHGADVNAISKFDKTPLDIAEDNRDLELTDFLVRHAANSGELKQYLSGKKKVSPSSSSPVKKTVPLIIKTENNLKCGRSNSSEKVSNASKPVFLRTNLQKSGANFRTLSSDSEEGETSEQGCTNVLATLAALAEATAPNATISTSEALQWLEMNGITMLPTDNSTVVGSAVQGGQTVSLTEAGKLALTWVKEHQNNSGAATTSAATLNNQKVITLVADQPPVPSIISSPIVVLSSPAVDSPPVKKIKLAALNKENGTIKSSDLSAEEEKLKLRLELEKTRKEAELYKAQLTIKEHEAEQYRKELEQMKTLPRINP